MTVTDKIKKSAAMAAYDYMAKDPEKNIPAMLDKLIELDSEGLGLRRQVESIRDTFMDPKSSTRQEVMSFFHEVDDNQRRKLYETIVVNGSLIGTPIQKRNRAKYGCNIPWTMDGADIVHVMMPFSLGKRAAVLARRRIIPLSAGFHVMAENVTTHVFMQDFPLANRLTYQSFSRLYRQCRAIHYPTQYLRDLYEGMYGPTNGYVISNGVSEGFRPRTWAPCRDSCPQSPDNLRRGSGRPCPPRTSPDPGPEKSGRPARVTGFRRSVLTGPCPGPWFLIISDSPSKVKQSGAESTSIPPIRITI